MNKSAIISPDGKYRYQLSRIYDEDLLPVAFVGLNPSTADEVKDDRTIMKCLQYSKKWGYGGFHMVNLFAYRSKNPKDLLTVNDPIGEDNNFHLKEIFGKVGKVVCCWGNYGKYKDRNIEVLKMIDEPYCLRINKSGEPSHPLYLTEYIDPLDYYLYKNHNKIIKQ